MSAWIGLGVTTGDERWEQVNQLDEDADPPHITLAYLGNPELSESRQNDLRDVVTQWRASCTFPTDYQVRAGKYDMFAGGTVTVLLMRDTSQDALSLLRSRGQLSEMLENGSFSVDNTYSFFPHITVGYSPYVRPNFDVRGMLFSVNSLFVQYNGQRILEINRPEGE